MAHMLSSNFPLIAQYMSSHIQRCTSGCKETSSSLLFSQNEFKFFLVADTQLQVTWTCCLLKGQWPKGDRLMSIYHNYNPARRFALFICFVYDNEQNLIRNQFQYTVVTYLQAVHQDPQGLQGSSEWPAVIQPMQTATVFSPPFAPCLQLDPAVQPIWDHEQMIKSLTN